MTPYEIVSLKPKVINNWLIKVSVLKENVMCIMYHLITAETHLKFFQDEMEAAEYISFVLHTHQMLGRKRSSQNKQ
jgi:hypothetical protein